MSKNDQLLGYCGLYCGNCLYYQNTALGKSTDPGDGTKVYCEGCGSDKASPWCTDCGIKKCGREKGMRFCLQCADYPCEMITGFIGDPMYPYHKEVHAAMKRLLETDLDTWSEEMDKKYTCGTCGRKFSYFDGKCPDCEKENK